MSTASAQTKIETLKATLSALVASISSSDATTQELLQESAYVALDNWENAKKAEANIVASSASSYSSGVGVSVSKRRAEAARLDAKNYMDEFVGLCDRGGVIIPTFTDPGVALWDLGSSSL